MPDWRSLYPFAAHFFETGSGARLHYLDEGPRDAPGSQSPLLMVHGNPTWSFYWRNLVVGLRDEYRCVVPDHIGCGLSDKPQRYRYELAQHIDNLAELVEKLDLKNVTLLAHDWGGAIGLGALLQLPQRFARIVLFNTGAFPPPFVPWRIAACRIPIFGQVAIQGFNLFARAAISMATEKPERMTPQVRAGLLAPYDSWANRIATYRFVRDIPFSKRHPTWHTLGNIESQLFSQREKPIALIWGMRDWCFDPRCLARFRQHWPNAEVHELADCGHYVVEDAHERIVPIVREFLRKPEA